MLKIQNVDMVNGKLLPSLIRFTVPVMLIGLVQTLFGIVDMAVLGQMADSTAVAAVAAPNTIDCLLVNAFFGIATGAKVVLSRLFGAQEEDRIKKAVSTSMMVVLILGMASAVVGILLARPFLTLTKCPQECLEGAVLYMRIYLSASPAIMIYNFGTAILNVSGDSQRPLYYMLISGGLNVVGNILLCLILPNKIMAVALSSLGSQVVGAVLVMIRLMRMDGPCRLSFRSLKWSNSFFGKLMVNGLPIAFNTALYQIAGLQIQASVNSFGASVMAGNSAAANLESLIGAVDASPWGGSTTTFIGQNLGADRKERVKKTIFYCLGIAVGLGVLLGGLVFLFSNQLVSFYAGNDSAAVTAAQVRMKYTVLFYFIAAANGVLLHVNQAFGYSAVTTANSICSVLLFRVFWMTFVYPSNPTYDMLSRCYLISWILSISVNAVLVLYLYNRKFKKGKLKKM